jgi:hypothetical protein
MGLSSKMLVMSLSLILLITGFIATFGLMKGSIEPAEFINRLESFKDSNFYMIILGLVAVIIIISFVILLFRERFKI